MSAYKSRREKDISVRRIQIANEMMLAPIKMKVFLSLSFNHFNNKMKTTKELPFSNKLNMPNENSSRVARKIQIEMTNRKTPSRTPRKKLAIKICRQSRLRKISSATAGKL